MITNHAEKIMAVLCAILCVAAISMALSGCATFDQMFSGELTPEQRQARVDSLRVLMAEFDLNIDDTKAAGWYVKQRDSLQERLDKADALWGVIEAWGTPSDELIAWWVEARDSADAVITVLDGFVTE